ncbi:MAG: hypothetical protein JW994_07990, partial [Candidatus Omnitrophica bacterium]|nr:hypothetical protein [Candidatus Omnitrophota bacterium]
GGSMYREPGLVSDIKALIAGEQIVAKSYDQHGDKFRKRYPIIGGPSTRVIIVQGVYASNNPIVRELSDIDLAITEFSDAERLKRKIARDIIPKEEGGTRGYPMEYVLLDLVFKQFNERRDVLIRDMQESSDFIWDHLAKIIFMRKKSRRRIPLVELHSELTNMGVEGAHKFNVFRDKNMLANFTRKLVELSKSPLFELRNLSINLLADFIDSNKGLVADGVLALMRNGLQNSKDKEIFNELQRIALNIKDIDLLALSQSRASTPTMFSRGRPTESIATNIFGSEKANWIARSLLSLGIIPHELSHIAEGLITGRIALKDIKPMHLLQGTPGEVRGPPALIGMLVNAILGVAPPIVSILVFGRMPTLLAIFSGINLLVFLTDTVLPIMFKFYRQDSDLHKAFTNQRIVFGVQANGMSQAERAHAEAIINSFGANTRIVFLEGNEKENVETLEEIARREVVNRKAVVSSALLDFNLKDREAKRIIGLFIDRANAELFSTVSPDLKNMTREGLAAYLNIYQPVPYLKLNESSLFELETMKIYDSHAKALGLIYNPATIRELKATRDDKRTKCAVWTTGIEQRGLPLSVDIKERRRVMNVAENNDPIKDVLVITDSRIKSESDIDSYLGARGLAGVIDRKNVILKSDGEKLNMEELYQEIKKRTGVERKDIVFAGLEGEFEKDTERDKGFLFIELAEKSAYNIGLYRWAFELLARKNEAVQPGTMESLMPDTNWYRYIPPVAPLEYEEEFRKYRLYTEEVLTKA